MTAPPLTPTRQAVANHTETQRRLARYDDLEAENATLRAQNAKLKNQLTDAKHTITAHTRLALHHDNFRKIVEREYRDGATVIRIEHIAAHLGWDR